MILTDRTTATKYLLGATSGVLNITSTSDPADSEPTLPDINDTSTSWTLFIDNGSLAIETASDFSFVVTNVLDSVSGLYWRVLIDNGAIVLTQGSVFSLEDISITEDISLFDEFNISSVYDEISIAENLDIVLEHNINVYDYGVGEVAVTWNLDDNDCSSWTGWTDEDNNGGVSDIDPAGQWREIVSSPGASTWGQRKKDFGTYTSFTTFELRIYVDSVGAIGDNDQFYTIQYSATKAHQFKIDETGVWILNPSSENVLIANTDIVKVNGEAQWQTWRIVIDWDNNLGSIYLKDEGGYWQTISEDFAAGITGSYSAYSGMFYIMTRGYTNASETHISDFKLADGAHVPSYAITENLDIVLEHNIDVYDTVPPATTWDLLKEECNNFDRWDLTTATTQEINPAGQFHQLATGTKKATQAELNAGAQFSVGNFVTISFKVLPDQFGIFTSAQRIYIGLFDGTYAYELFLYSDGLFTYKTAYYEIGTNILTQGVWADCRWIIDTTNQTADFYLDGVLIELGFGCGYPAVYTAGLVRLKTSTYTAGGTSESHWDYVRVADGDFPPPSGISESVIAEMDVLVPSVYDVVTVDEWDKEDNDCSTKDTWSDLSDSNCSVSINPAGQWYFYAGSVGNNYQAEMQKEVGALSDTFVTLNILLNLNDIGDIASSSFFSFWFYTADGFHQVSWASDGLFGRTVSWIEICGAEYIRQGEWQEWRIIFDTNNYTVDVYLRDDYTQNWVQIGNGVSAGRAQVGTNGQIDFNVGSLAQVCEVHIDKFSVSDGAIVPEVNVQLAELNINLPVTVTYVEPKVHFKLNDNLATTDVIDSTGNYSGTVQGGDNTSNLSQIGKINNCFLLDGSADAVWLQSFSETDSTISYSMWFKGAPSGSHQRLFDMGKASSGFYVNMRALHLSRSDDNYGGIPQNSLGYFDYSTHNNIYVAWNSDWDNVWIHIIVTHALNSTATIYVNNSSVASGTVSTTTTGFTRMSIGNTLGGDWLGNYWTAGYIDDFRWYDFVLSSDDRDFIYNSGTGTEDELHTSEGEAVSITEDVSLSLEHSINVYDSFSITEDLEINLTELFVDVYEEISIIEDVDLFDELDIVTVYSEISIVENITMHDIVIELGIVYEEINISEDVDLFDEFDIATVYDSILIIENVNVFDIVIELEVYEEINILEDINLFDEFDILIVYDSVSIIENISVNDIIIELGIVYEEINIVENIYLTFITLDVNVAVYNVVAITENITLEVSSTYSLSAIENLSVSEDVSFEVEKCLNIYDSISITENFSGVLISLPIPLVIDDSVTITVDVDAIVVSDELFPRIFTVIPRKRIYTVYKPVFDVKLVEV